MQHLANDYCFVISSKSRLVVQIHVNKISIKHEIHFRSPLLTKTIFRENNIGTI